MEPQPALLGPEAATRLGADVDDEELIRRVSAGDPRWCEVFVRRHNARLFRVARAIVKDDELAEDVTQETYLRAFRCLHQFEGRSSLATWLTRIAVHEAIARRRRHAREEVGGASEDELVDDVRPTWTDPEQALQRAEVLQVVSELVDGLPEPLRLVFVLREVEGMTGAEVAEALSISEENVKVRLFRARGALRRGLQRSFEDVAGEIYGFHLVRCDRVALVVRAGMHAALAPPWVPRPTPRLAALASQP